MKTIRIFFADFWEDFPALDFKRNPFLQILSKRYKIFFDNKKPQYLFFSVFGKEHFKYPNAIKIFFSGECISPDFNYCDYAIGFDYINFKDRYLRYPIFLFDCRIDKGRYIARNNFLNKTKFCSFIYSNDWCTIKERIDFFKLLNKYKKVDSGGRILNNIGAPVAGGWKEKDNFLQSYKFNIAFENTIYDGYTTEKITDSFRAGCIPIYYGDPLIGEVFNEKAFINCHKFKSFDDVVKKVIEIDNNEELRLEMLKEPILIKKQDDKLEEFLFNIFEQDIKNARRRPSIIKKKDDQCIFGVEKEIEKACFLYKIVRIFKNLFK